MSAEIAEPPIAVVMITEAEATPKLAMKTNAHNSTIFFITLIVLNYDILII